jgi:hypothetical protein
MQRHQTHCSKSNNEDRFNVPGPLIKGDDMTAFNRRLMTHTMQRHQTHCSKSNNEDRFNVPGPLIKGDDMTAFNRRLMFAMCDRYGVPDVFFTLTPCDEISIVFISRDAKVA